MAYELWDKETRNVIGGYDTEAEALAAVRGLICDHGREYIDSLFLGYENARGRSRLIAEGQALADRALAADSTRAHLTRG